MQAYQINENGCYIKPVIINNEEIPNDCIIVQPPHGLYRAKWIGTEWIEDMTQEEIEALNSQPKELPENEMIMLAVADLDMQREIDKTEMELAIAELAETLLGGTL